MNECLGEWMDGWMLGCSDLINAWMYLLDDLKGLYKRIKEQIGEELNV